MTQSQMEMKYSILLSLIVFLYAGFNHVIVCSKETKSDDNNDNKAQENAAQEDIEQENTKNVDFSFIQRYAQIDKDYYKETYYLSTHNKCNDIVYDKGKFGEYLIYKKLKHYEQLGAKVLFNCYLNKEDNTTTEIDVMLICQGGIFVFESKNYSGMIFGDERSLNWTQVLPDGKGQAKKIHFYNPVKQNNTHIKFLKKLIDNNIPVYSVIVFSDECTLRDVKTDTENVCVIQCKEINTVVNELSERTEHKLDTGQISEIFDKLYPFTQVSNEIKEKHIENIERQFESDNSDDGLPFLICPRCGSKLVLRISGRGESIGKSFYGCASFPKCQYTLEIAQPDAENMK